LLPAAADIPGEFGVTGRAGDSIQRIGYATNLDLGVVASAIASRVDLVVTHHDAWEFLYGLKAQCAEMLRQHRISHLFAHLPLDAADFGTAAAFAQALGVQVTDRIAAYEGWLCGRVGILPAALDLPSFVHLVEQTCGERVRAWHNSARRIRRVGIVPGAGLSTSFLKECADRGCDVYVTGESSLYTLQYARYAGINLVVGSHTFTEIFGVEALVHKIAAEFPGTEAVRLFEPRLESAPDLLSGV
jgi:putative NIF3 family GTP cyclohydrolase 1 type 2